MLPLELSLCPTIWAPLRGLCAALSAGREILEGKNTGKLTTSLEVLKIPVFSSIPLLLLTFQSSPIPALCIPWERQSCPYVPRESGAFLPHPLTPHTLIHWLRATGGGVDSQPLPAIVIAGKVVSVAKSGPSKQRDDTLR